MSEKFSINYIILSGGTLILILREFVIRQFGDPLTLFESC